MNALQDDKGNYSSMRVILLIGVIVFFLLLWLFYQMVQYELNSDQPINYTGLALFFSAIMAELGSLIWGKVHQKKIENGN